MDKDAKEEFLEQEEVFRKIKVGLYGTAIGSVIMVCPGTMKIALWALALGYSAVVKHRETSPFCGLVSDAIYGIFKKFQNIKDDLAEYKTNFLEESTPSMRPYISVKAVSIFFLLLRISKRTRP